MPISKPSLGATNWQAVGDALIDGVNHYQAPTVTLTDASTVTIDATAGSAQRVTVAGNRVIGKPSNGFGGQRLVLTIVQDGTGSRVWTLAAGYRVRSGDTVTPSTSPAARDKLAIQYDATADVWDVLAFLRGDGDWTSAAWQFRVEDYGARGDGKMLVDAAISASSTTLTSARANFTSADVGKKIMVNEAGATKTTFTSGALFSTISSVTNSTTVVLANAATRTVSGQEAMYGTDDTAAIQSAMEALGSSAAFNSGTYYAELLFQPKIYILATAPVPGGNPANLTYGNAQIPLPHLDDHTKTKPTVVLKGGGLDADTKGLWLQTDPQIGSTCLFSMYEAGAADATYGAQSVIGGPNTRTQWANPNSCNNVLAVIDNLQVLVPVNPGQIAFDFLFMAQYAITTASAMPFAGVVGTPSYATATTNTRGIGLRTNSTGFNDRSDITNISIEGFYVGMTFDEHMAVHSCRVIYSKYALYGTSEVGAGSSHSNHGCWFGYASLEITDYCVYTASGGGGSLFTLVIDLLDNEGTIGSGAHINDPNNVLTGRINIMPSASATLPQTTVVNGGKNLEIKSTGQPRGAVTAPSVPATTVALKNPFYRDAIVNISGGTVTAIAVDGTATGLTSGSIILPSGLSITLTYSSAPTWTWVLM